MTTTTASDTTVNEIAAGIYRISTPVPPSAMPGGFTFNQFLIVDEQPLLFHTGMRRLFPAVREAVARVIDPATLRWIGFSHVEDDECGALPDWLAIAPERATGLQPGGAMISLGDMTDRPARGMADGEELVLGPNKRMRWLDAPHLPHNWECGYMFESSTRTLLAGDLFTQPGADVPPLTESEVLTSVGGDAPGDAGEHRDRRAHAGDPEQAGRHRAADARAHARQLVPGRRCQAAACIR